MAGSVKNVIKLLSDRNIGMRICLSSNLDLSLIIRYIMSMAVADWSGQAWLQGFNEAGLAVFGKTADEVHEIKVSTNFAELFLMFTTTL